MTKLPRRPLCFAHLAFAFLAAVGAHASTLVVTTTADSGTGSLRQAIASSPAGGSIEFNIPTTDPGYAPTLGTFFITLSGGELAIGRDLTITGPTNAKLEIDVNGFARAFNIVAGSVSISNLTISRGSVAGVDGADAGNQTPAVAGGSGEGGGILNNGTLTLSNCTVSGNSCSGGHGGSGNSAPGSTFRSGAAGGEGIGAGISNNGTLTMRNCTVTGNTAVGGPGGAGIGSAAGAGGSARGSGVASSGALTMTNCTIYGNSASGANGANNSGSAAPGAGGSATGGGVAPSGASTALLQNTIIAGNSVSAGTAGVNPNVPPAPNGVASGPDVGGTVMSQGHNLIGRTDGSNGWSASDLLGGTTAGTRLDPLLGPLQDNGGIAQTRRPLPGSAAIDSGDDAVTGAPANLLTDERNYPRKIGTHVDIGAVETGVVQAGPTFTVTNLSEHTNITCSTDDCSLVEALNASNASSDANVINFAPTVLGVIRNSVTAGLSITNPVTINGPGARVLAVSGDGQSRGFDIAAGATVTISGLTIRDCNSGSGVSGGAIQNAGTLTLNNCSVLNNSGGSGGGVATFGTLTVNNCTFGGNQSTGNGAALRNTGVMHVTNSTFSGNVGVFSGAIASFVNSAPAASVTINNCTISGNQATGASSTGGGVLNGNLSTTSVANTIIYGNNAPSSPDVVGVFSSQGANILGNISGSTGFSGDHIGTPNLNPNLGNNGGPTDTLALLAGSFAINNGNNANAPATDQRGYLRSGASDIGAYEFNGTVPVLKITSITRLPNGHVSLQGLGIPNTVHTIQAASDPSSASFSFLGSATSDGAGVVPYDDAGAVSLTRRFYRLTFP